MKKTLILTALPLSLAACNMYDTNDDYNVAANDMPMAMDDADMMASTPTEYVRMAGASDLYEIESSQLALQKSRNPEVREFAQRMITHHRHTTDMVMAAARDAGLTPAPPQLMPMQRDMVAQLRSAEGADFDRMYVTQQRKAHEMALTLHSNYSRSGNSGELSRIAEEAEPVIRGHIERLQSLRVG